MLLSKPSDKKIYFVEGDISFLKKYQNSHACGLMKLVAEFLIYGTWSGTVIDLQIY